MPSSQAQQIDTRLDWIKLPKITKIKDFRIRSNSKDALQKVYKVFPSKRNETTVKQQSMSQDKFRSSSLRSTRSHKTATRKSEQQNNSLSDEVMQARSCKITQKLGNRNNEHQIKQQHQKNMKMLQELATIFDPKIIMKIGQRKRDCSHENIRTSQTKKTTRGQLRINKRIFNQKSVKKAKNDVQYADEYWKKVNQSLILTPCKNGFQEVSKDLRDIYETFVTE